MNPRSGGKKKKMVTLGCRSFFVGYLFWLYRRDPNLENVTTIQTHTPHPANETRVPTTKRQRFHVIICFVFKSLIFI